MSILNAETKPGSFGYLVEKWFKEQHDLQFLALCCQRDDNIHFIRVEGGSDKHIAAVTLEGKFYMKIDLKEDVWDNGVTLHIADADFFTKLHSKLLRLYGPQRRTRLD